jgi:hypothetical protein
LAEKQEALNKRQVDLQRQAQDIQGELARKNEAELGKIVEQVTTTVQEIAKKQGYTFVFERDKRTLVYASERIDITSDVIEALDQKKVAYIIYAASTVSGFIAACFVHQQEYFLKLFGSVLLLALFFAEVLNRHRQRGKSTAKVDGGTDAAPSSPASTSAGGEEN